MRLRGREGVSGPSASPGALKPILGRLFKPGNETCSTL